MDSRKMLARTKRFNRDWITGQEKVFRQFEAWDSEIALALKPSFEQYIGVCREVVGKDFSGRASLEEVERRIPHNPWINIFRELFKRKDDAPQRSERRMGHKKKKVIH